MAPPLPSPRLPSAPSLGSRSRGKRVHSWLSCRYPPESLGKASLCSYLAPEPAPASCGDHTHSRRMGPWFLGQVRPQFTVSISLVQTEQDPSCACCCVASSSLCVSSFPLYFPLCFQNEFVSFHHFLQPSSWDPSLDFLSAHWPFIN